MGQRRNKTALLLVTGIVIHTSLFFETAGGLRAADLRPVDVVSTRPAQIPIYKVKLAPVTWKKVTLKPDWSERDVYRKLSATREKICLNGLWAFQPAEQGATSPRADDWAFLKVPGMWHRRSKNIFHLWGSENTSWHGRPTEEMTAGWYLRDISVPVEWKGRRLGLYLGGSMFTSVVYVDGKRAGTIRYPGGSLDLSTFLRPGSRHQVCIWVDGRGPQGEYQFFHPHDRKLTDKPSKIRGLTGDVYLFSRPAGVNIKRAFAMPDFRNKRLGVRVTLHNPSTDQRDVLLSVVVRDAKGQVVLKSEQGRRMTVMGSDDEIDLWIPWKNPHLWSPDDPYLYTLTVQCRTQDGDLLDESLPKEFGFRQMWVDGKDIYLNGKIFRLRPSGGDNSHFDWPPESSRYFAFQRDLGRNCAFWYGQFYYSQNLGYSWLDWILSDCDRSGMMILGYVINEGRLLGSWERRPDFDWKRPAYNEWVFQKDFRRWMKEDAMGPFLNHPSLVSWGGFGFWDSLSGDAPHVWGQKPYGMAGRGWSDAGDQEFLDPVVESEGSVGIAAQIARRKPLEDLIREIDPSRMLYYHNGGMLGDVETIFYYQNWQPLQEIMDVIEPWTRNGIRPIGSTEQGQPYPWAYESGRAAGPDNLMMVTEYAAIYLGNRAYALETDKLIKRYESEVAKAKHPLRPRYNRRAYQTEAFQQVAAINQYHTVRAWRTWGISAGVKPCIKDQAYGLPSNYRDWEGKIIANPAENLKEPGMKMDNWTWRGCYSPSPCQPDQPERPTGKKRDFLSPFGEAWHSASQQLLCYIAGPTERFTLQCPNYFGGEKLDRRIATVWDGLANTTCRLEWSVTLEGHGEVGRGDAELRLQPGEIKFTPLVLRKDGDNDVKLPKVSRRTSGKISLTTKVAGKVYSTDEVAITVFPRPAPVKGITVGLYDPAGTSGKWLKATGARVRPVSKATDAQGCSVLVIGRGALRQGGLPFKLADLPHGINILILEHSAETLEGLGFRSYPVVERNSHILVGDHPAFAGLAKGDLSNWRVNPTLVSQGPSPLKPSYAYHQGNWGAVASVVIEKPTRGPFTPLTQSGFDLNSSALIEASLFGRQVVFCQMSLVDGYRHEPTAAVLTHNLLRYLAEAKAATKRGVIPVSKQSRALLDDLGIAAAQKAKPEAAIYLLGPDIDPDTAEFRAVSSAVKAGAVAVCIMPGKKVTATLPAAVMGKAGKYRHFPLPHSQGVVRGLGVSDFHYRDFFDLMTYAGKQAGIRSWAQGAVLSVPQEKGRWVLVGFDPRSKNIEPLRYRHSRRHMYRSLAQILTNVGAHFAPVEAVVADRLARPRPTVNLVSARWYQRGVDAAAAGWQKPNYDDSSWTYRREFGKHHVSRVGVFHGAHTHSRTGHFVLRAHVQIPAILAGKELLLNIPGIDVKPGKYWFNGHPLVDLYRKDTGNPEQAATDEGMVFNGILVASKQPYSTPIVCPIAPGMVKAGKENVLVVELPGRYYDVIHNPIQITLRNQHPLYVGSYYPNDDPYSQRGF